MEEQREGKEWRKVEEQREEQRVEESGGNGYKGTMIECLARR